MDVKNHLRKKSNVNQFNMCYLDFLVRIQFAFSSYSHCHFSLISIRKSYKHQNSY